MRKPTLGLLLAVLLSGPSVLADEPGEPKTTKDAHDGKPAKPRDEVNLADEVAARIRPVPGGLTADDAGKRARAASPDVAEKREAVAAAAAKVDQAATGLFPRLTLTGRYARLSPLPNTGGGGLLVAPVIQQEGLIAPGTPLVAVPLKFQQPVDQWTFAAQLVLPLSDYPLRLFRAHAAASKLEDAAKIDQQATAARAATDAKLAFYQWVKVSGQRAVLELSLRAAEEHKKDADALFAAGSISKADVLGAEAQVASLRQTLDEVSELLAMTEAQLRVLLRAPDEETLTLGEDVTVELAPRPLDLAALKAEAVEKRPELRALAKGEDALVETAKVQRASELPRLDAVASLTYANPNPRIFPQEPKFRTTWDVGVQLSWTPNDALSGRSAGKETEANAAKLRAQRIKLRDAVLLEVTQAVLAARTADEVTATTKVGIAASLEAHRTRRELFKAGRATSVELTDAEAQLLRARLAAVSARIDQRIARIRLEHATGRDVMAR